MDPERTEVVTPASEASSKSARPSPAWRDLGLSMFLIFLVFAPVLYHIGRDWIENEDMGHGLFVPVIAGWIVWQRRGKLGEMLPQPCWWGLAVVAWGLIQLMVATLGAEFFLGRTAFLITLYGALITVCGPTIFRELLFPCFLLPFMISLPALIYTQITFPLQLLASRVAEHSLGVLGIPVLREGNVLHLASQTLSVVEACSGIRSLLSLSFLALVYGFFFETKAWLRVVLFFLTVPIAILANSGRVTMTAILSEYKPELAEGFFHQFEGWVIFMIALVLLIASHQAVRRVHAAVRG